MFKVNDYVMYSSIGVCQIINIRKEKNIDDMETEYYILQPAYNNLNMTIKIPVNNPKVFIREVITKDDVLSLIASMPEKKIIWINDDRERSRNFKAILETGESEEWAKLIKTIYLVKQEKAGLGKKLMKTDEEVMKIAEKNLYEEFALALNISPDEVVSYIHDHVPRVGYY